MNKTRHAILLCAAIITLMMVGVSCSTQHNTSSTRFWHAFNARYNTYFNGNQAYIAGALEKENGNKDNYTELIPFYTVANKSNRETGKANFDIAITKAQKAIKQHSIKKRPTWNKNRAKTEKDMEWLNRREYNPFIWKAWMLMGRSQFNQGQFDEAAATFSYMARLFRTQPGIYGKARAWLAKCYVQQEWIYDAEDVIRNMMRDSIDWRAQREWDRTLADYYIHTLDYEKAAPYLRQSIRHEMRSKQRARLWYLYGQILAAMGRNEEAYNAFRHVVRQNPPYELEFNARISMTEVMSQGHYKKKISKLRAMARSDKNAEYLDQVYYAMGNVYLAEKDTMNAIYSYEKGNAKATRSGIEKGVLLLHLGDLYWQIERFSDARRCYGEAIGLLDKDRKDYAELSKRSKILDELCPHTDAVQLQDSLQALAKMDEKERNEAIDRVITALKKKEKEEEKERLQKELDSRGDREESNSAGNQPAQRTPTINTPGEQSTWYFYNPMAVQQGKQQFQRTWGKRENADDWQRRNKTVLAFSSEDTSEGTETEHSDSLSTDSIPQDVTKEDTTSLDPHKREYYLAQIPFTEEQLAESNKILSDGLFNSGIIFKDKLDNLPLSEKQFTRLSRDFPGYEKMDEAWYHMFLLYSRKNNHDYAAIFIDSLKQRYPDSQWTKILTDPYFKEDALYGAHIEDSLYSDTYEAFRNDQFATVSSNYELSSHRFSMDAHRDKFIFITGLSVLNNGDPDSCLTMMRQVVKDYPQSEVASLAGMIVKGVEAGRRLRGAKFDIGDIWNYRSTVLAGDSTAEERHFTADRMTEFKFVMTYAPDSLNENQLLYELARYNFTNFLVRNFDIEIEDFSGMHRMIISGFRNFDEALMYTRMLYRNTAVMSLARTSRNIIISQQNLPLLGVTYSYNEYDEFYDKNFSKLPTPNIPLFNEQDITPEQYDPERQPSEPKDEENDENNPATEDNDGIVISEEDTSTEITINEDVVIPEEQDASEEQNAVNIPVASPVETKTEETPPAKEEGKKTTEPITPAEDKNVKPKTDVNGKTNVEQKTNVNGKTNLEQKTNENQKTIRQQINEDIIEIIDEESQTIDPLAGDSIIIADDSNTDTPKPQEVTPVPDQQDEDEYFELDGF